MDMSRHGARARSSLPNLTAQQGGQMHMIMHIVALGTRVFHMFVNTLPCSAVHHHTMGAAARASEIYTWHGLNKAPG